MWKAILIDFFISVIGGIISGIIVAIVSSNFIEKRIKKREEFKRKLILSLIFFEKLETQMSGFDLEFISKVVELRNLYSEDAELKEVFHSVDIGLSTTINLCERGGSASYDFCGNDYINFKNILERRII